MSQSKVSEWVSFLLPVLEPSLDKLGFLPKTGSVFRFPPAAQNDYLIGDVTERRVSHGADATRSSRLNTVEKRSTIR